MLAIGPMVAGKLTMPWNGVNVSSIVSALAHVVSDLML